jgi:outer membrane protein assembly factor BamB
LEDVVFLFKQHRGGKIFFKGGIMAKTSKTCLSLRNFLLLTLPLIILHPGFGYSEDNVRSERLDWHQWRGPNRDGISFEKNILKHWSSDGPEILWRISAGDGYSGISVSKDRLLTMWDYGDSQFLFCLDPLSGKELWRYRVGDNFRNGWGNGPRSTPIVDEKMVYAVSTQGALHAVNLSDGKVSWSIDLSTEYDSRIPIYGYSSSPLIDGDKLFVEVGGRDDYAFIALNKDTGDLMWHSETDEESYSSPIAITLNNNRHIVFLGAEGLFSLAADDGKLYWHSVWNARCPQTGIPVNTATPLFIAPDKIFISGGYGTITGATTVQIKWHKEQYVANNLWFSDEMNNLVNSSVIIKNHIYGFDDKFLKCVGVLTGEEKWKISGYGRGSLIAVDGHLIVLGERGKLALVEATPASYKEVKSMQIFNSKKCWTSPALANGKLYLRNHDELVCLDISQNNSKNVNR